MGRGMELQYLGWIILAIITLVFVLYSFNPGALSALKDLFIGMGFG